MNINYSIYKGPPPNSTIALHTKILIIFEKAEYSNKPIFVLHESF